MKRAQSLELYPNLNAEASTGWLVGLLCENEATVSMLEFSFLENKSNLDDS